MTIDVIFGPDGFEVISGKRMSGTVCVVFDVLRATSTMVTAMVNGAEAILPVTTVEEALSAWRMEPSILLAGERGGLRIGGGITGGREFDLGNSPREFTVERVRGRRVAMTTTNGTRALRACRGADAVVAGAFLNLTAAAAAVRAMGGDRALLVCSGTGEGPALEDALAAGGCCELLSDGNDVTDGAMVLEMAWRSARTDLRGALAGAANARRLWGIPELAADVDVCLRRDAADVVPVLGADGWFRVSET